MNDNGSEGQVAPPLAGRLRWSTSGVPLIPVGIQPIGGQPARALASGFSGFSGLLSASLKTLR